MAAKDPFALAFGPMRFAEPVSLGPPPSPEATAPVLEQSTPGAPAPCQHNDTESILNTGECPSIPL